MLSDAINMGHGSPTKLIDAIKVIADFVDIEPLINFKETTKGDVRITYADISKARRLLG